MRGKVVLASNSHALCLLPQQVDDFAPQMSSNTQLPEDSFVFRENLFGDQPGKRPNSTQSRRSEALGFCITRQDMNPATPAITTDVSITPLGCFVRRPNRDLRQRLFSGSEASNCVRDLGFRYTR